MHYNLFLIGFMGCGKSTIASALSKMLGAKKAEMDEMIAMRENMSISDIFATRGEEYFRKLETELLADMQGKEPLVISCGGGVPMREANVAEMKKSGKVILLTARPETVYDRVKDSHDRPLLEGNKNIPYIAELMERRREKYEAAADIIIETDNKTAQEICAEIMQKIS